MITERRCAAGERVPDADSGRAGTTELKPAVVAEAAPIAQGQSLCGIGRRHEVCATDLEGAAAADPLDLPAAPALERATVRTYGTAQRIDRQGVGPWRNTPQSKHCRLPG